MRAIAAREAARAKAAAAAAAEDARRAEKSAADATLLEGQTTIGGGQTSHSVASDKKPVKKKVGKPKLTAKEKKERSVSRGLRLMCSHNSQLGLDGDREDRKLPAAGVQRKRSGKLSFARLVS